MKQIVSHLECCVQMSLNPTIFFIIYSHQLQGRIMWAFEDLYPTENMEEQTENVNVMIVISSIVNEMVELFKCMSQCAIESDSATLL